MKKIYIFFILIFTLIYVFTVYAAPVSMASNFSEGLKTTAGKTGAGYPDLPKEGAAWLIAKMLGSALTAMFMGVTGMLSLMYGGYKYLMSRGNEQDIELGKRVIYNTLIAMFVAFSVYGIVNLVIRLIVDPTLKPTP